MIWTVALYVVAAIVVLALGFGLLLWAMCRDVDSEIRRESIRWRDDN
jgi:uncharacterized membrane protein